jgi:hypothetical protein
LVFLQRASQKIVTNSYVTPSRGWIRPESAQLNLILEQEQLLVEKDDETMALPKQKPVGAIQLAANKFPRPDLEEVAKLLVSLPNLSISIYSLRFLTQSFEGMWKGKGTRLQLDQLCRTNFIAPDGIVR